MREASCWLRRQGGRVVFKLYGTCRKLAVAFRGMIKLPAQPQKDKRFNLTMIFSPWRKLFDIPRDRTYCGEPHPVSYIRIPSFI